ncbi:M20/M25/M40 family metallo-hydrolase [Dyadobacter subterraneus]|uniref:M20/M25/M40 family metallo-hydrolase n=1 Tax=Dyadobacter subterraneus TaxID=2773304 RepID=A0ABR9WF28_9BACT|nr:M20/M25/M40 family metallo-hydrolase [Dyadobacter subterraneus]MBE9463531.1 M20/M25/M40 family metallo-hydrolase [Dyadobacter subterraneus]
MTKINFRLLLLIPFLTFAGANAQVKQPDWKAIEQETMLHFQTLLRINTSDPGGTEAPAVAYMKSVLEKEGIKVQTFSLDPNRPNLVARISGSGKKRPVLIMAHTDVVSIDSTKWTYPAFSATRKDGYVYGRGAVDDKDNVATGLMLMLTLKRLNIPLDRDVIFLAESGEEGNVKFGIDYMVKEHWPEIEAEYCFAEGGGVTRTGGKIQYAAVATTEKVPRGVKLVARGISGHGSVPLRSNAIVHLSQAIVNVAAWQTPMRLNETTQAFFQRLAEISSPEQAARYKSILSGKDTETAQEYLAVNEPRYYSTLRTSISPNIFKGGYRSNVIPSEAEASLDIRALPDEDMPKLLDAMRQVINDPQVEIISSSAASRPGSKPSSLTTEAFKIVEAAVKSTYNTITLPTMLTGATDMSFLRAKGIACYGIGPMMDSEDGPKGFGAHSDQERILEESLHKFLRFQWEVISNLASAKK